VALALPPFGSLGGNSTVLLLFESRNKGVNKKQKQQSDSLEVLAGSFLLEVGFLDVYLCPEELCF
jgi:hypothetical protein